MSASELRRLLADVVAALRRLQEAGEGRVIHLASYPLGDDEFDLLRATLGAGAVTVRAAGPEHRTWRETSFPGLWWGEAVASPGNVALFTLEVGILPRLPQARAEDVAAGRARLEKVLQGLPSD